MCFQKLLGAAEEAFYQLFEVYMREIILGILALLWDDEAEISEGLLAL